MDLAVRITEVAFREGEIWSQLVYTDWLERGWCLPPRWPLSFEHAVSRLDLPPTIATPVTKWLARLVDAGARTGWSRLHASYSSAQPWSLRGGSSNRAPNRAPNRAGEEPCTAFARERSHETLT